MSLCGSITSSSFVCLQYCLESEVAQSFLTLCDPMDCSLLGSSVHGIFQARVLEWVLQWSPFPSPGDRPKPGIEPGSPTLQADTLLSDPPGKPPNIGLVILNPWLLCRNFRILLSIKKKIWAFDWDYIASTYVWTELNFTILNLPVHEWGLFLHLFSYKYILSVGFCSFLYIGITYHLIY